MSTESLNRTSDVAKDPSLVINTRVNVDVLKQRIIDQKKKDKFKRTIIFSTVCVSLGALTFLANWFCPIWTVDLFNYKFSSD